MYIAGLSHYFKMNIAFENMSKSSMLPFLIRVISLCQLFFDSAKISLESLTC